MVSTEGVGWRVDDGPQWFPGKAPWGCAPPFTQSALLCPELDKSHFTQKVRPPFVCTVWVFWVSWLWNTPFSTTPSCSCQWWPQWPAGLPRTRHPKPSPHLLLQYFCDMLPQYAMICSIRLYRSQQATLLGSTLLAEVGIMSQCWCLRRLGPKEHTAMSEPFFSPPACLQSSFKEIALQQLPKQSQWAECLQCWDSKGLILVEDIRHSVFFPCFHWNFIHFLCNMKSSLPVNFYHGVFGPARL